MRRKGDFNKIVHSNFIFYQADELEQKLSHMKGVQDRMKQYTNTYKKYQNYLERVVNDTGEFQSINDIFNRYETLIDARQALSDHQDRNLQMLEDKSAEIVRAGKFKTYTWIHYGITILSCRTAFNFNLFIYICFAFNTPVIIIRKV